jgi:signal transduction histidine kinase
MLKDKFWKASLLSLEASPQLQPQDSLTNTNTKTSKPLTQPWHTWLISKPFDWISTPIYLGACLRLTYDRTLCDGTNAAFEWWQLLLLVVATLLLLASDRYEYWRWGEEIPKQIATRYFLMRVGLIIFISYLNPNEITLFMYVIVPFSALLYFGSKVGIGVGLITWLVFVGRVIILAAAPFSVLKPLPFINIFTICVIFLMTTAYTLRREKASRTRAERLLKELEQSQLQVEELAATRERNRLARDIHDSLGHYLTVISVLLGKAKAFKEKNPTEAEQALSDARRLANEALQDVRESVKSLRTSQELFSLERNLPMLVANLTNEHLNIALSIKGSEAGFSKQALMVLYRVAQEGLTNVQRHSNAKQVTLELKFDQNEAELVLEDNGQGFDPSGLILKQSGGYGLRGLQERFEMVGGEFRLDSQPGQGTRLVAKVFKTCASPLLEPQEKLAYVGGATG